MARGTAPLAQSSASIASDARTVRGGQYYLLDMGREQYGDCILCVFGDKTVLIDAGHPSDFDGQEGYVSIPDQIAEILGQEPPFDLTLLVVTHAHNDHIGCLPKMIDAGMLKPKFALVADPDLGFPPGYRDAIGGVDALDDVTAVAVQRAVAALSEEDHSFLSDAALESFLDAATTLGMRYRSMLAKLARGGAKIFKWGVADPTQLAPIYQALVGTGFDIIGPSKPHLEICRDQTIAYSKNARDALLDVIEQTRGRGADASFSAADLYRMATEPDASSDVLFDRRGQGSSINCQSIVLKFGTGDQKVLLAADMQFHEPEVDGLDEEMADLRSKVVAGGPYKFVKTTHHTSYNGIDPELWNELGKPPLMVHSGGLNDDKHPEPGALNAFRELARQITFARTDHNGQIIVDPSKEDRDAISISRGRYNDFTPNPKRRARDITRLVTTGAAQPKATIAQTSERHGATGATSGFVDVIMVRIPYEDGSVSIDGRKIEISGRGRRSFGPPHDEFRQRVRTENPPEPEQRSQAAAQELGGGRDLSKLLFVTDAAKLARNIGREEAARALRMISDGAECFKIDGVDQPEIAIRRQLAKGAHKGVVIVGGYDVVPSQRVDVLDAALRAQIPRKAIIEDRDEFIVWSDDVWGDIDGENMPDVPVSRIPDARFPELVFKALSADKPPETSGRFGIRNTLRPFAVPIFETLPGREELFECAPMRYSALPSGATERPYLYFMLHGLDSDGSRFWGEQPGRGILEAINTANLPSKGLGVALAGCCWGALTIDQRAQDRSGILSPKPPESSMALSTLLGGANAFVGCTGVHYSPGEDGDFFGGPMHLAFWKEIVERKLTPAEALFEARRKFLADMPHNRMIPLEIGIERKMYKQFTCLGLGW
jgi:beta-lactamase superfamily II metal-dependent hydrolase